MEVPTQWKLKGIFKPTPFFLRGEPLKQSSPSNASFSCPGFSLKVPNKLKSKKFPGK